MTAELGQHFGSKQTLTKVFGENALEIRDMVLCPQNFDLKFQKSFFIPCLLDGKTRLELEGDSEPGDDSETEGISVEG